MRTTGLLHGPRGQKPVTFVSSLACIKSVVGSPLILTCKLWVGEWGKFFQIGADYKYYPLGKWHEVQ